MADDITQLKVDTEVLKTQITSICVLCQKMDKIIEKIVDNMDQRTKTVNEDFKEVHNRIDTVLDKVALTEHRIMDEMRSCNDRFMVELKELRKEVTEKIDDKQESIDSLSEWKWKVAGGVAILSWLISNLDSEIIKRLLR